MIGAPELANRFTYHPPRPAQVAVYQEIREMFLAVATRLDALVPASREKDEAFAHLDATVMFANAGIARRSPDASGREFG